MTTRRTTDNIKLGTFVFAGLVFLVFSLYMIGKNRNIFSSTISIMADFRNINGLMEGNNVRFSGIDIGTVERIDFITDSSVRVTMLIDEDLQKFIRSNSVASVGTDGLMGNKLVNIRAESGAAPFVKDGDIIRSQRPIETDAMLQTLSTTNENIAVITQDLRQITSQLNAQKGIWRLFTDTAIVADLRKTSRSIRASGENAERLTRTAAAVIDRINYGKGPVNQLFTDTALSVNIKRSLAELQSAAENLNRSSKKLEEAVGSIGEGKGGLAGVLLTDTASANKLRRTLTNIEQGTDRFNVNMEALRHHFLFRGYFKDQEKEQKAEQKKKEKN